MCKIAKKNLKNYVIKLSTKFSIVTEFTSFVAVEHRDEVNILYPLLVNFITQLELIIKERRLRWFGHMLRMDDDRIPKQAIS